MLTERWLLHAKIGLIFFFSSQSSPGDKNIQMQENGRHDEQIKSYINERKYNTQQDRQKQNKSIDEDNGEKNRKHHKRYDKQSIRRKTGQVDLQNTIHT